MSSGGAAGVATMKATAAFPQPSSHMPTQHSQPGVLQPNSVLQPASAFNQQMQQQHLLQQQQQQQQRAQAQHAQQLHRLPQAQSVSTGHLVQSATVVSNAQPSVFPNAEFFQTLQQTAAAALPTVLPYDQSQYIGPLMYFPYPAAANGLFAPSSSSDSQHPICSPSSINAMNPVSSNTTNQLIGTASLVSATPGGMVSLNHLSSSSGQVHGAGHLLAQGSGIVSLATGANNTPVTTPTAAPASLAPLFTTAHFYPQHATPDPGSQSQLHLQHSLQHTHNPSLHMQSQVHSLAEHAMVNSQPHTTTTLLLPGQVYHSSLAQANSVNVQSPVSQRHMNSYTNNGSDGSVTGNTTPNNTNGNNHGQNANGSVSCDVLLKNDETVHSTPTQTPHKSNDSEMANQNSQLTNQSLNGNSGLEVSSSSTKRDHNGTGHFVCGVCGREFGMRCRLIAHTRRHTGERPFPCADCGRAFSDRGNLQRHRYTHSSQPRFHCSVCGKSFRQASCLSNHRRFHCAGATGRPCPFCQRSFRSSSSLQMHIRWKHRADAAAAVAAAAAAAASATGSSEPFTYLPGLATYMPVASVNGIPPMSINGGSLDLHGSSLLSAAAAVAASAAIVNNVGNPASVFSSPGTGTVTTALTATMSCPAPSSHLNPLINSSTTSPPNKRKWRRKPKPKQNAFGRLTGGPANVLSGINLSEGIDVNAAAAAAGAAAAAVGGPVPLDRKGRPCNFPCPACPRRFAFQCRLAAHLRCHTNIRPFICIDCGRAFTQRGYLVRHAAVHKLDRPFSCGLCDRSYKHYGSLVNHKRTHSKLNNSNLTSLTLLPGSNVDHIGCDVSVTPVTGLSSLEEVVRGAVGRSNKTDGSGVSNSSTTITLLPVSKVEEILPGDLDGSIQQICLPPLPCPPGNLMAVPDRQHAVTESHNQPHPLPHQLTATAVWPILASGNTGAPAHMLAPANVASQMAAASHFPTLTLPPQGVQATSQSNSQHPIPMASSPRQQQISTNGTAMLSATSTPTFVTLPLFASPTHGNNASHTSIATSIHAHPSFHGTGSLVSTTAVSDSSQPSHSHPHQQPQAVTQSLQHHHPASSNQQQTTADSNTASMLHVLQPSPSIFFSPYYLPHTAASQM